MRATPRDHGDGVSVSEAAGLLASPAIPTLKKPTTGHLRRATTRLPSWRRLVLFASVLAIGVVAVFALLQADLGALGASLTGADPALLGVAVGAYLLAQTLSGTMWARCQRAGGVHGVPTSVALGIHWVARTACELLPASLGEAVRVALVRRHPSGAAAGTWRIAGGIAGYKAIDAAVTGAFVLVLMLVSPPPGPASGLRWTAVAAVVAIVAAALAWRVGGPGRLLRLMPRRARGALSGLGEGAGVLTDAPAARSSSLLGIGAVLARVASLAALLAAFGAPAQAAGLAFAVIVMAGAVPGLPGGAGARELVLVPALALAHGVSAETALAFSLAVQAVALVTTLAAGAVAMIWLWLAHRGTSEPVPVPADPVGAPSVSG